MEIGSEFWDIPISLTPNNVFLDKTQWFMSGRIALRYILKHIKKTYQVFTAALPSWCCDSMIKPFLDEGFDISFYPVYWENNKLLVERTAYENDVMLVLDYFGYTYAGDENNAIQSNSIIIRDITHSLFSKSYNDADYYFGSLRKWAGFYTGGFAFSEYEQITLKADDVDKKYVDIRSSAMKAKNLYISGRTSDKHYLSLFREAEEYLDFYPSVCGAYQGDISAAKKIDVIAIKDKRRKNAQILLNGLREYVMFKEIEDNECPMFVPILVENRDVLRQYLIDHKIYCPVHWPISEYHRLTEKERYIYEHELSLVCDQRYETTDMYRTLETIYKFLAV